MYFEVKVNLIPASLVLELSSLGFLHILFGRTSSVSISHFELHKKKLLIEVPRIFVVCLAVHICFIMMVYFMFSH